LITNNHYKKAIGEKRIVFPAMAFFNAHLTDVEFVAAQARSGAKEPLSALYFLFC
jgi:hypothetical protein